MVLTGHKSLNTTNTTNICTGEMVGNLGLESCVVSFQLLTDWPGRWGNTAVHLYCDVYSIVQ